MSAKKNPGRRAVSAMPEGFVAIAEFRKVTKELRSLRSQIEINSPNAVAASVVAVQVPNWGVVKGQYCPAADGSLHCSKVKRKAFKAAHISNGKVNGLQVYARTRQMLRCESKGDLCAWDVSGNNPIPAGERGDLAGVINSEWFDDVNCQITRDECIKAAKVSDFLTAIFNACRPAVR